MAAAESLPECCWPSPRPPPGRRTDCSVPRRKAPRSCRWRRPTFSGVSVIGPRMRPCRRPVPPAALGPNPADRLPPRSRRPRRTPDPYGTLTGQPAPQFAGPPGLPHGSYPSPVLRRRPGVLRTESARTAAWGTSSTTSSGRTSPPRPRPGQPAHGGVMVGGGGRGLFFLPGARRRVGGRSRRLVHAQLGDRRAHAEDVLEAAGPLQNPITNR